MSRRTRRYFGPRENALDLEANAERAGNEPHVLHQAAKAHHPEHIAVGGRCSAAWIVEDDQQRGARPDRFAEDRMSMRLVQMRLHTWTTRWPGIQPRTRGPQRATTPTTSWPGTRGALTCIAFIFVAIGFLG
jgi:hypothetical protein